MQKKMIYFIIYFMAQSSDATSTSTSTSIDKSLKIMIDLCMDYGHLTKFVDQDSNPDLLFAICQFEDSIRTAQKYLSGLKSTGAVNKYINNCGIQGYDSVEDLISLPTTLWDDSRS
jgi:hypothetical protein